MQPAIRGKDSGKRPILLSGEFLNWTPYQTRQSGPAERALWWPHGIRHLEVLRPDVQNMGIVTGSVSNLVVIDIDDESTYEMLLEAIPEMFDDYTVKSGRGYHVYVRPPIGTKVATTTFEWNGHKHHIKAEGGYVVAPPSAHYLGSSYTLLCEQTPTGLPIMPVLREWDIGDIAQRLIDAGVVVGGAGSQPGQEYDRGWLDDALSRQLREHEGRHDMCVRIAGHLAYVYGPNRGDQAMAWLRLWNDTNCIPPLPERELQQALDHGIARELRKERDT